MPILSKLFFLGKLEEVRVGFERGLCVEKQLYGYAQPHTQKGVVTVRLEPVDWSAMLGVESHRVFMLSVLLPECVHAFLESYGCQNGCERCEVANGRTGHGRAWFHLASSVQTATRKMLGVEVAMSVYASMVLEDRSCDYVPSWLEMDQVRERRMFPYGEAFFCCSGDRNEVALEKLQRGSYRKEKRAQRLLRGGDGR